MLYDSFPHLADGVICIRKMTPEDLAALREITDDPEVCRYVPPLQYRKKPGELAAALRAFSGRDFERRKRIVAGIFLEEAPERLIGLAEIFGCSARESRAEICCRINKAFWNRGIATHTAALLRDYLLNDCGLAAVCASVMPENVYAVRALLRCGFRALPEDTALADPTRSTIRLVCESDIEKDVT